MIRVLKYLMASARTDEDESLDDDKPPPPLIQDTSFDKDNNDGVYDNMSNQSNDNELDGNGGGNDDDNHYDIDEDEDEDEIVWVVLRDTTRLAAGMQQPGRLIVPACLHRRAFGYPQGLRRGQRPWPGGLHPAFRGVPVLRFMLSPCFTWAVRNDYIAYVY